MKLNESLEENDIDMAESTEIFAKGMNFSSQRNMVVHRTEEAKNGPGSG